MDSKHKNQHKTVKTEAASPPLCPSMAKRLLSSLYLTLEQGMVCALHSCMHVLCHGLAHTLRS